ncbi:MAG: LysR family transcriptional regulator [Treponema sp.]|jgi:lysyl-tRNA synthetase class 2|nr:LysR family transcriptional regulator [Treponema sp.]
MDLAQLQERSRVIRAVRSFFDRRGYLEVDTPLLSPDLIPETCLEVFETLRIPAPALRGGIKKGEPYWLVPSPEIWMKRLIARHRVSMYQICKCFRNGESSGRLHSPEFTMLEYYTMDADYLDSLKLTEELFAALPENPAAPPFLRVTVEEAFSRWAGIDLYGAAEEGPRGSARTLAEAARRLGLEPPPDLDTPALYDLIFIHAVEPALPRDRPVALTDYPAFVPCLAKKGRDRRTVERWELYVNGVELANCYSEETEPEAVRRYFEAETAAKNRKALVPHRVDPRYWELFLPKKNAAGINTFAAGINTFAAGINTFAAGIDTFAAAVNGEPPSFPRCSGVAMGLDRLIMALTGRKTIDGVLPFPMEERLF